MVSRLLISFFAFILILPSQINSASIEFEEILTFSVPGLNDIDKIDFGDVDFDGHPDVLASDGSQIVLYSTFLDSVLYSAALALPDPIGNEEIYQILLADINRDTLPDISIGIYNAMAGNKLTLKFINGSTFYGSPVIEQLEMQVGGFFPEPVGLKLFDAVDFDLDGYNEFVFSCDSSRNIFMAGAITADLYGLTRIYHSFPDSLLIQNRHLLSNQIILESEGNKYMVAAGHHGYYYELGEDTYGYGQSLNIINPTTDFMYWGGYESYLQPLAAGEIILASPGNEILVKQNFGELILCRFTPPDLLTPLWSVSPDTVPSDCIYLPDFSGYYFGFIGGRFVQFNGDNGSEFQSTANVPTGARKWDVPFNDGQPHLVTLNSSVVSIYKPDVITDIDDNEDPPVPTMLNLGQPYPNPFNAIQTIPVTTRSGRALTVDVYNLLGQKIDCIFSGVAYLPQLNLAWKADNFASGIYFIMATSDDETVVKKSILLK